MISTSSLRVRGLQIGLTVVLSVNALQAQFYKQTNLVSDIDGTAQVTDPHLVNPWGVSLNPTGPFWVSDAGASVSTLYVVNPTTGTVTINPLVVNTPGPPSGQVFNPVTTDFVVTSGAASGGSAFIFAELNGTIAGWSPAVPPPAPSTSAQLATTGAKPAAYTGIALGLRGGVQFLYAANPAGQRIDVYDRTFASVTLPGTFADPALPAGDAPFNIANIDGRLFVAYTGPTGVINEFDTEGNFLRRFATGGTLKNPWGMVKAPSTFGKFAGNLLVGNFNRGNSANGPGYISAFEMDEERGFGERQGGEFRGLLKGTDGNPLQIDGLWALVFGNGGNGGSRDVLYFSAGIQNETHGLFGGLSRCSGPMISNLTATPSMLPPPDGNFVTVSLSYTVTDDCAAAATPPQCQPTVSNTNGGGNGNGNGNRGRGHERGNDRNGGNGGGQGGNDGNNGNDGDNGNNDNNGNNNTGSIVVDAHTVQILNSRQNANQGIDITVTCTDALPLSATADVVIATSKSQQH